MPSAAVKKSFSPLVKSMVCVEAIARFGGQAEVVSQIFALRSDGGICENSLFSRGLQAVKVWALVREDAASITAAVEASLENMLPADFGLW